MDAELTKLTACSQSLHQQWWESAAQQVVVNVWWEHWGSGEDEPEHDPENRFRPYLLHGYELPAKSPRWAGIGEDAMAMRQIPVRHGESVH